MVDGLFDERVRYAAWLEPDAATAAWWQPLLDELRAAHDGAPFVPHVTLTSGIEGDEEAVVARFRRIAARRHALPLELLALRASSHRFQAITLAVRRSAALIHLRGRVRGAWGLPVQPWDPHLSLLYARLGPERQQAILDQLAARRWPGLLARRLSLWRIAGDTPHWRRLVAVTLAG